MAGIISTGFEGPNPHIDRHKKIFASFSVEQLVEAYNGDQIKDGATPTRSNYLAALREALLATELDCSGFISESGMSMNYPVRVEGGRITRFPGVIHTLDGWSNPRIGTPGLGGIIVEFPDHSPEQLVEVFNAERPKGGVFPSKVRFLLALRDALLATGLDCSAFISETGMYTNHPIRIVGQKMIQVKDL